MDRFVMRKFRKIQAEGFQMPGLAKATDGEIDLFVGMQLRKIQAEGFGMEGLATASDAKINHFVIGELNTIRTAAVDGLIDGLDSKTASRPQSTKLSL